jgi:hypothetical protein
MKVYRKGGAISMPNVMKPSGGAKLPRPEAQPTNVTKKIPDVSSAPFLGPSITSRPKPRKI